MKEYARSFYQSQKWRKTSKLYMQSKNYICERCGDVATICHHKKYINPANIDDINITLNPDNLECLCHTCHQKEHFKKRENYNGVMFDESGNLIKASDAYIVCGAPGSGKTTFVMEHKGDNDIVFDFDYICSAIMGAKTIHGNHDTALIVASEMQEAFLQCVEQHKGKWEKAWIITGTADKGVIKLMAYRLKAETIIMQATLEDCIERINNDPDRLNKMLFIRLAEKWFTAWEGQQ